MNRSLWQRLRDPATHREKFIQRITILVTIIVLVDLVASAIFLAFENNVAGSEITNYGDALYWTSTQLTTVSNSLTHPATTGGRILAVVLDFFAVGVVATLIASVAHHIHILDADLDDEPASEDAPV